MKSRYIFLLLLCYCIPNYGTAMMIQTQEGQQKFVADLLEKQQAFEIRLYVLIGFIVLLVLLFGLLCFLNKRGDKRLETIISLLEKSKLPTSEDTANDDEQHALDIDEAVVTTILYQLKEFEKERGFLVSKITLHAFAKSIQTNTKYLSKVVNAHKLKSFRNYINDLRIQYSIHELEHNTKYRKYTVKAMAEDAGFATATSFSKAFQKKTGVRVSAFLERVSGK